jgi:gliding motility-associated lipoprotein GldD
MNKIISLLLIFFSIFYSCVDSNLPKQSAFLRIEFPEPNYIAPNEIKLPIDFYYNLSAADINVTNSKQFSLNYPKMNLIVDMSLNKLTKRADLENNFRDFSLTLETHSKKSNGIFIREYEDLNNRVYAKIFELRGDVASPIQFYLTDSTSNFINGSLNLKFKSKYDSIFPTIQYVKNDILVLVESLNWNTK